jgi:tetratricopeptide (TPR) repeat protein
MNQSASIPPQRTTAPSGESLWQGTEAMVVIDDTPVMGFWAEEIASFAETLRTGLGFRGVQRRWMSVDGQGGLAVGAAPGEASGHPDDLLNATQPTVIFLITHGRSAMWHKGLVQPVLASWATTAAVAVVNLLPQQSWHHSGSGMTTTEVVWERTGDRTVWRVVGLDIGFVERREDALVEAVPVLESGLNWLERWSRVASGSLAGPVDLPAVLVSTGDRRPETTPRYADTGDPVARFRAFASPMAFTLATRLAAAPLNERMLRTLPRTVPRAGTLELTEVLTSDLVRPVIHDSGGPGETRILFDFVSGVREQLLKLGYRDRTIEVQHVVEGELAYDIEAVRGLTQRIKEPAGVSYPRVSPATEPFLRVERAVHLSLGGANLIAAELLSRAIGSPVPPQRTHSPNPRAESNMSEIMRSAGLPETSARPATGGNSYDRQLGGGVVSTTATRPQPNAAGPQRQPTIVGGVPPQNPDFTGREDLLEELHRRLEVGTTAVLPEAVHGRGGVGKSALVVEYVYQHEHDFDLIWWIPAERPVQIQNALGELAARLNLEVPSTANTAVPAVLEALRVGRPVSNWLLVFDNAEQPADVERFFPKGGPGSIVVTSRNEAWRDIASSLPVNVFDRDESIEMLRGRGPELGSENADRLAAALGDLPLAIELAAAWRAETEMSAENYLELLQDSRPGLSDDEVSRIDQDYPELVAAAWNVSLNGLRDRDPAALRLLQVCAYFAPEPISTVLLSKPRALRIHPDLDPLIRNPDRLRNAIRTIGRLSLARIDHRTNTFQMHRLVQRVLVSQMGPEDQSAMKHGAHLLLAGNDPNQPDEAEQWPRYAELYPHLVSSRAEECPNELVRDMVLNEAKYLWRWGDHAGSRELAQRAYSAWSAGGNEARPDTLGMAAWLGWMHFVVGDYAAAAGLNARTLELYRETLGDDQEQTLDSLGAVAADQRVAGDFAGALDLAQQVYEQSKRRFGEAWPFTLRNAHNLAVSMRLSSLFGPALRLDEQTHKRMVQMYGTDHPTTLNTQGGVNLDRRELGDYVAAHASQENVVATGRRVLRYDDHPDVLRQSHSLASFRRKAGDHVGALELSSDVRHRYRSRYDENHPDTVLATLTLSIDQRVTGDLRTARQHGEEAVAGLRRLYGEDHPHTAGAQVDLAVTLRLLNEAEYARTLNEQALRRLVDRLGESHALVLAARINLASDHYELGEYERAGELDRETLRRCRELLGELHPTTLACAANLAMDLRALKRGGEASDLFEDTIERFRRTLGENHPATAAAAAGVRANCDIDPLPL